MSLSSHNLAKIAAVKSELAAKVSHLIELAAAEGVQLHITDGFRSPEEQNKLYAQGRTTKGKIVTYKKGGQSRHNLGEAVDVVPIINGQPSWSESFNWSRIGKWAAQVGLDWGGNWKTFKDRPHLELPKKKTLKE